MSTEFRTDKSATDLRNQVYVAKAADQTAPNTVAQVPGLAKQEYADNELTAVHINLPKILWQAVNAMARLSGTSKTNIVVRALNKEAYFERVFREDPHARVFVEHGDDSRERVVFV